MFAGHRIERRLGTGGMGAVYLAWHPTLPRPVALKLPDPALTRDPQGRDRFLREAEHAARLDHPNIVAVYDRGRVLAADGEQLWISMQYVDGTDAATPLRHGPMAADRAVRVARDIALALDHAHAHGILHRDVKPANILLAAPRAGAPERALLADFGIAKSLDAVALTRTGTVLASLQYASPEQIEGRPLGARSDQYALGCTLYHLLTGRPPYPGTDTAHLVHAHLNLPVPRVGAYRPDLPTALDTVIARALAKNPADRFESCGALAAAAQDALAGRTTTAALAAPPTATLAAPPTATVPAATTRPRRLLVPVAATAAIAALAAAGVTAWLVADPGESVDAAQAPTSVVAVPPTTPTTPTTTTRPAPTSTAAPSTTGKAAAGTTVGHVDGADAQGFADGTGPRCKSNDLAVGVARTEDSAVVVCRTKAGRYYSRGMLGDDDVVTLDNPTRTATGFVATDGTVSYLLDADALTITDDGDVVSREPVLEYRSTTA